jgi:hypothetical protein
LADALVAGATLDGAAELAGAAPPPHAANSSTADVKAPARDRDRR